MNSFSLMLPVMSQQPDGYPEGVEFHTDLSVGEILRRTRVHYEQSLEEVGSVLRIRPAQLSAIEEGNIDQLPGRVYAIGFIRSYAELMGLDGEKMVHLFKQQNTAIKPRTELQFPMPAPESKAPHVSFVMVGVVGAVLLLAGWMIFFANKPAVNDIPEVPPALTQSSITQAPPVIDVPPEPVAPPAPVVVSKQITFDIVQSSWVEIKNKDGASILRQVLKPGDKYLVPEEEGLTLSTGNAGGIIVKIGDAEGVPLGKPAEIKRGVALDPATLFKN